MKLTFFTTSTLSDIQQTQFECIRKHFHNSDHINRNKLDNKKSNLRICTNQENQRNKKSAKNSSSLGLIELKKK